jgi:DNA-binding transcriptional ArsR family regulator
LNAGWLAELIPPDGYIPDFLTPPPAEPKPTIDLELATIRATPDVLIRADLEILGRRGPRGRALHADPENRLIAASHEIETYWEMAIAPYWDKIFKLLEADVFHRAWQVAERGTGYLLNDLHSTVSWDGHGLQLVRRQCGISRSATGLGLLLVPSAFATNVLTWARPSEQPQLAYPARGTASLWEHCPVRHSQAIAAVIGRSRTILLTELDSPTSTTDLARRTRMSPSAVSHHLTTLRDAGMVSAHRAGRSVLYARTAAAESLLASADDQPGPVTAAASSQHRPQVSPSRVTRPVNGPRFPNPCRSTNWHRRDAVSTATDER